MNFLKISCNYVYRSFDGTSTLPWYERGKEIYRISRTFSLPSGTGKLELTDRSEIISQKLQRPDWGYHITLRPEPGSRLMLPSLHQQNRDGSPLPVDMDCWVPAKEEELRT